MENIKKVVEALNEFREQLDVKIVRKGDQWISEKTQDTPADELDFQQKTYNHVLKINDSFYCLNIKDTKIENRYRAKEEEWVDITETRREDKEYRIMPLYVANYYDYKTPEFSEAYENDILRGENNVPKAIEEFATNIRNLASKSTIEYDEYDEEYDPEKFITYYIGQNEIKTDVIFDIQLNIENLPLPDDAHEFFSMTKNHNKEHPKSELLQKFRDEGINIEDMRKLNAISNQSGKPKAFLNKLNQYSNTEMTEMFHMMHNGEKVVEIFSKDLDKFEDAPKAQNKRERTKKLRQ